MYSKEQARERLDYLRRELHRHNQLYYVRAMPIISDYDFDLLMNELILLEVEFPDLEDDNSPTKRVGSDLQKGFVQSAHSVPMLSLSNSYSEAEVIDFFSKAQSALGEPIEIVCELKFDGVSISLIYEEGRLVQALTRGDGTVGDDVTANVRTIRSVPLYLSGDQIPKRMIVRGEILMPFSVFDELNRKKIELGDSPFANPRNATAGSIKLLDSRVVADRKLDTFVYHIYKDGSDGLHSEHLFFASQLGFKVSSDTCVCRTMEEVVAFIRKWDVERRLLPFAIDGIVLKINSVRQQRELGFTSKSPRWATAFKFAPDRISSSLLDVTYQVGRTGVITPVAELDPISIAGTTVKRATLHNEDFIRSLGLYFGDSVFVEKGGEIIPKIVGVDLTKRREGAEAVVFVTHCPACGALLVRDDSEAANVCPNYVDCPAQQIGRFEHFMSRKAMNIAGGEATSVELYRRGLLKDISDFFGLKKEDLYLLDRWGERSADNFIASIERARTETPFERVLFAIGIKFVGEVVAKKLVTAFGDIDRLMSATKEELMGVDEIGERIAESIIAYFSNVHNRSMIERLRDVGVCLEQINRKDPVSEHLLGKSIVISGVFSKHSREEYKSIIEQHGGKSVGSISNTTSFVLMGDKMGPAKQEKAMKLGVELIEEDAFLLMIGMEQ